MVNLETKSLPPSDVSLVFLFTTSIFLRLGGSVDAFLSCLRYIAHVVYYK